MKKIMIGMAALLGAVSANAAVIPTLIGVPQAVSGGFRYTYEVYLTPNAQLQNGDGFTIFDFAGFIAGSNLEDVTFDGLDFSFNFTGPGYDFQNVPDDNASVYNLTWTYTGNAVIGGDSPRTADTFLGTVSAVSKFGPNTTIDNYSCGYTGNGGLVEGTPAGCTGSVAVPLPGGTNPDTDVPEPGMLGLLGLGVIGVAAARRRKVA